MSRAKFPKPVQFYSLLRYWGNNIVASEGEEWKRYRKLSAPAFSEVRCFRTMSFPATNFIQQHNSKLVWDETVHVVQDMFQNLWSDKGEIIVDHCLNITMPVFTLNWTYIQTFNRFLKDNAVRDSGRWYGTSLQKKRSFLS